jgi:hypothetical protein
VNSEPNNPKRGKAQIFVLSAFAAIAGGLVCGILAGGVFDAVTGYGLPNPFGTFGAILGAVGGGVFTSRYLRSKNGNG